MKTLTPFLFVALVTLLSACGENGTGYGNGGGGKRDGDETSLNINTPTCRIKIEKETSRDAFCKKLRNSPCNAADLDTYLKNYGCI